ncbi:MAG: M28 family peptidase [bacterium]|jgi:hypothetical protein
MKLRSLLAAAVLLMAGLIVVPHCPGATAPRGGLARIVIENESGLDALRASGIPVYARSTGPEGIVLITGTGPAGALETPGLEAQVLDHDISGKEYYECLVLPNTPEPDWAAYGELLYREANRAVLAMSPDEAVRLAGAGVDLRAIITEPKPYPGPARTGPAPLSISPDPDVENMIDAVESLTVYAYTGDLSGEWPVNIGGSPYTIETRNTYSGTPITRATEFVGEHLEDLGLDVEYHVWGGSGYPNVIAEIPGQVSPDSIVIICGHVDDMPSSGPAPGADDNASGSVAVLIAADIMSRYTWHYTLRFALWTGEEQGLYGSYYYAQRSYQAGEEIVGVLNLDMIAYNTTGSRKDMDLHADEDGTPASMDLAHLFVDVIDAYDLDLVPNIWENGLTASDHSSFWNYGYAAILAIEDWDDFTPYYHTSSDMLQTLDMGFYVEFVKACVATFAHMGVMCDDLSGVNGVARGDSGPASTMLHPARPNPAGSAAVLKYDIAGPARVELRVYDAAGRLVRTLIDRPHVPGAYEVAWDGMNESGERNPPGVYFLSLKTGAGTGQVQKVVLVR